MSILVFIKLLQKIRQNEKGFLLTSKFCTQKVFCPCLWALYMCMYKITRKKFQIFYPNYHQLSLESDGVGSIRIVQEGNFNRNLQHLILWRNIENYHFYTGFSLFCYTCTSIWCKHDFSSVLRLMCSGDKTLKPVFCHLRIIL